MDRNCVIWMCLMVLGDRFTTHQTPIPLKKFFDTIKSHIKSIIFSSHASALAFPGLSCGHHHR